jgi:hypothetical protein
LKHVTVFAAQSVLNKRAVDLTRFARFRKILLLVARWRKKGMIDKNKEFKSEVFLRNKMKKKVE